MRAALWPSYGPVVDLRSQSRSKEKATARHHSRPWPKKFFRAMTHIPPPDAAQGRAGNGLSCANCGKRLHPKRGSRRMRFCSVACRQSAFRAKKWASRYEGRGPLRPVQNNAAVSKSCNGHLRGASGICAPTRVVSRELLAGFMWCLVVSPDGVRAEVARLGNGAGL
jgi:hypothetical protein